MLKHIVLFKVKEFKTAEEKISVLNKIKSDLEALKEKIDVLRFIEVGLHYELDSPSFDIALTTHFDSVEDLKVYADHPDHLKVVDFVRANVVARAAVDYEV